MPHEQFASQIEKTGFVLENRIAQQLKSARWTVISNRYYVDDAEESIREIDLIAYRVSRIQHFDVYTTLIISCKKSDVNAWALLARDIDLKDPNSDWQPLHAWTNDKALAFQLGIPGCAKRYHEEVSQLGVKNALQTPEVEVFAFQEMNKVSGAPQNDKNIFSAVTSLMKAQAYELGALPQRKKTPSVYQFNLLSVVDADLFRLMFSGEKIEASPVEAEHYIARYIIRKSETFSRIRFLRANKFAQAISDYGNLHQANCQWLASECSSFYDDIVQDSSRIQALIEDFRKEVGWYISWRLEHNGQKPIQRSSIYLHWDKSKKMLEVSAPFGMVGENELNNDSKAKDHIAKALKNIYRYAGPFKFEDDDIPF